MKKYSLRILLLALSLSGTLILAAIIVRISMNPKAASLEPAFSEEEPPSLIQRELDSAIRELTLGQIEYNPPLKMKQYREERIEVRISQSLNEDLTRGLKGRGIPNIENIPVSSSMKATLSGDDFKIRAYSETVQPVLSAGFTQWEWSVTPQRVGKKTLHLSIAAVFKTKYGEMAKSYPVMDKTIIVAVSFPPLETILKYVGIIIGIIGGLIGIIKALKAIKRKREPIGAGADT